MERITQQHGAAIQATGKAMVKKQNIVYLRQLDEDTEVETAEGVLQGHAGGYVAYDPLSGHVWPIASNYAEMHYELPTQETT